MIGGASRAPAHPPPPAGIALAMRPAAASSCSRRARANRRRLLQRFGVPFEVVTPSIAERPLPRERPAETALRLAEEKARQVAAQRAGSLVVGCDQVAELDDKPLGKPLDRARNIEQLTLVSGRRVAFHSALCLIDGAGGRRWRDAATVLVTFRPLSRADIETYVDRERAFDCAGGFKCESLGITLVESIVCDDPTALEGLPLIALARMLRYAGMDPLAPDALDNPDPVN